MRGSPLNARHCVHLPRDLPGGAENRRFRMAQACAPSYVRRGQDRAEELRAAPGRASRQAAAVPLLLAPAPFQAYAWYVASLRGMQHMLAVMVLLVGNLYPCLGACLSAAQTRWRGAAPQRCARVGIATCATGVHTSASACFMLDHLLALAADADIPSGNTWRRAFACSTWRCCCSAAKRATGGTHLQAMGWNSGA